MQYSIVGCMWPAGCSLPIPDIDKYLDLARELKKPWNMKVTVILIIVNALEKEAIEIEK